MSAAVRVSASLVLVLVLSLSGCAPPAEEITVGGREREYILDVPEGLVGPAPLVVVLHGGAADDAAVTRRYAHFHELGATEGFVTAYPSALVSNWNDGRVGEALEENADGVDDVEFIGAMVDEIAATHPMDLSRVYVTGASNGGFMTERLACSPFASRMAAAAPIIATMAVGLHPTCMPPVPLPILLIAGDSDPLVPFAGGEIEEGTRGAGVAFEEVVTLWTDHNACVGEPSIEVVDDDPDDGTRLSIRTWTACDAEVRAIVIEGGGHSWPGGRGAFERRLGVTTQEMDGTDYVWRFVSGFAR